MIPVANQYSFAGQVALDLNQIVWLDGLYKDYIIIIEIECSYVPYPLITHC